MNIQKEEIWEWEIYRAHFEQIPIVSLQFWDPVSKNMGTKKTAKKLKLFMRDPPLQALNIQNMRITKTHKFGCSTLN